MPRSRRLRFLGQRGSSAPGVTATSITFGTHQPLTGPGRAGLQRDRAGLGGVLQLRQRARRRVRPQDPPDLQGRRATTRPTPSTSSTSSCSRARCSGSSKASARRPTRRSSATSTPRRCPTCSSPPAARAGTTAARSPYTFGWQPNYTIEGKILGQYIKQHFAGTEGRRALPGRRLRPGRPGRDQGRAAGEPDRRQGGLPAGRDHARAADHRDQGLEGARCWSTSPCRSTRRSAS